MALERLLYWLIWIAVVTLLMAGLSLHAIGKGAAARRATLPPQPETHKLFHYWAAGRWNDWVSVPARRDDYGSYYYQDVHANVAVLATLHVRKVLQYTVRGGIAAAGEDWATLFARTRHEVTVHADRDTFMVIGSDLTLSSFELQPNDVAELNRRVEQEMKGPAGRFCLVSIVRTWAAEHGHEDLYESLKGWREDQEVKEYAM